MDYSNPADCLELLPKLHPVNVDETRSTLTEMIGALLDAMPPAAQHLEVLEAARAQIAFVQAEYARHYASHPLPPDSGENRTLLSVVELWRMMARSYAEIARRDTLEGAMDAHRALLLQRRLQYTGLALLEYLRAHRALPAGMWADLHECFIIAEQSGTARTRVDDPLNEVWQAQSAMEAYVAVMLVDLSNPFGRSEREFNLVCKWAQRFAPFCSLGSDVEGAQPAAYALDLTLDHGLRPVGLLKESSSLRRFDGSKLAEQIQTVFGQLKGGATPGALGLGEDCPSEAAGKLLVSLYRPWGLSAAGRRFPRRGAKGSAALCGDWLAIGFHIGGKAFVQPATYDRPKSLYNDISLMTFGERALEVDRPRRTRAELERVAEQLGFASIRWQVADQSVGGFRLQQLEEHERLEHHQLIGILPPDGDHYLLGQISWLMYRGDGVMEAGVHILPGLPQVVAARVVTLQTGNRTPYNQAFLLPGAAALKTETSLVLPHGWYQPNRVIETSSDGHLQHYRLKQVLMQGPNFDQVAFEEVNRPA